MKFTVLVGILVVGAVVTVRPIWLGVLLGLGAAGVGVALVLAVRAAARTVREAPRA